MALPPFPLPSPRKPKGTYFICRLCKGNKVSIKVHEPIEMYELECECGHIGLVKFETVDERFKDVDVDKLNGKA